MGSDSSDAMEMQEGYKDSHVSVQQVTDGGKESKNVAHAYGAGNEDDTSLRRLFSFAQLLAFSLTFMESWEVMAMNMGATFWNGGPRSLAWGIVAVVIGSLAQAYSMAELGAIQPIAGAQYHWTNLLAPAKQRRFITWMQGKP